MKYKIKNCPCFCDWSDDSCSKTWEVDSFKYIQCKDISDCLLKQIVERCKSEIEECDKCKTQECAICLNSAPFAKGILNKLKIEECK